MRELRPNTTSKDHPDRPHEAVGFPREQIEGRIVDRFEMMVRVYPDRIAVVDRESRISYDTLNRAANRVAHAILECGERMEVVPIILGHSASAVIAAVGVLKARKAYCHLDPSHPEARLRHIIDELETKIVVTDKANAERARALVGNDCRCLLIDDIDPELSVENPAPAIFPLLAAIFYTSGSTGKPKGVQHTHRTIQHRVWLETNANDISRDDRISLLFSMSFGASVCDLFSAILNGATLCIYDLRSEGLDSLASWLIRDEITIFHIPVAPARQFLSSLSPDAQFPDVRILVPSGAIFRNDLPVLRRHFPNSQIVTHMGASETSVMARMVVTDETPFEGDVVPLGYPVADKEVMILDDNGTPLPPGEVGEIAVRSRYITLGYFRRPDLTEKTFFPDPDGGDRRIYRMGDFGRITRHGYIEYLGRRDQQVKIRGYRVELGEVEAALYRLENVQEAAVFARQGRFGEKKLVAWVVLKSGDASDVVPQLRSTLGASLPDYMVPTSIVILPALPRTDNGKVDSAQLPEPERQRPALTTVYIAPGTTLEVEVAALWCDLLDLETVGINDNFLDLGGHSLMAMQLVSRISQQYGISISPGILLQAGTIEQQARIISERLPASDEQSLLHLLKRVEGLSEEQVEQLLREGERRG